MNMLKERVTQGRATRALWLEAGSPVMAEAAVYAGMRFVLIDNEHGPAGAETTAHMVRAIEAAGGHPMARVAGNDVVLLKNLLEIGVKTLMVPMVDTAEAARAAVAACKYPPQGQRGYAADIRATRYGRNVDYARVANDDLFLMIQIESPEGVENAAEIAAVPGVDMVFIGPYDMSGGYGKLGETDCPEVEAAITHIQKVAKEAGKPLGTVPRAGQSANALLQGGFSLVVSDSEIGLAMAGIARQVELSEAEWL